MADMPLDERLEALADIVAMTVEDETASDDITAALDAAADAVREGDMEAAHEALTAATTRVAELVEALPAGEAKDTLEQAARELGRVMEETAGGILDTRVRQALGR